MVMWLFSDDPKGNVTFVLINGHVAYFAVQESDLEGIRYRMTENRMNRFLVAQNDNKWFDKASQSIWKLDVEKPGTYILTVYLKKYFKN